MSLKRLSTFGALAQTMNVVSRQPRPCQIPSFLLPLRFTSHRTINTTNPIIDQASTSHDTLPDSLLVTPAGPSAATPQTQTPSSPFQRRSNPHRISNPTHSPRYSLTRTPSPPASFTTVLESTSTSTRTPFHTTPSLLQNLSHLASQPPFYITVHIHGKPYLVTAGDTIRLPFLMHGVLPGDILRLNRASVLGSREWTLKAGSTALPTSTSSSTTTTTTTSTLATEPIPGRNVDLEERATGTGGAGTSATSEVEEGAEGVPRFRHVYLDERLFTCRAVVLGTESEPMRIKEKTKRRQRRTKRVKSKHRYTVLKIREVEIAGIEEVRIAAAGGVEM